MRPWLSVAGTRCTRCTPPSNFSRDQIALVRARLDRDRDVLVAAELGVDGVEDLGGPAAALRVAQVHAQQVAGEQRRLRAALPRLDLEDDVLVVVGVLGQQLLAQPAGQLLDLRLERRRLGGERRVLAGELTGGREVAAGLLERAGGLDQRRELRVAAAQPPGPRLVGVHRRVGELALQGGVLVEQDGQPVGRARALGTEPPLEGCGRGHDNGARPTPEGAERAPSDGLLVGGLGAGGRRACRSASRTGRRGHRCRGSSACRCRRGGTPSRPRRSATGRGRAAGGEGVAATTGHGGLVVRRVDVGLHAIASSEKSLVCVWWNAGARLVFRARRRGSARQYS